MADPQFPLPPGASKGAPSGGAPATPVLINGAAADSAEDSTAGKALKAATIA